MLAASMVMLARESSGRPSKRSETLSLLTEDADCSLHSASLGIKGRTPRIPQVHVMSCIIMLVDANLKLLDDAARVVSSLDDRTYSEPTLGGQRVGAQFRHVVEVYLS